MRVRIRRIAKSGCLSLGSVMLVVAVVGYWWDIAYVYWTSLGQQSRTTSVWVSFGTLELGRHQRGTGASSGTLCYIFIRPKPPPLIPGWRASGAAWSVYVPTSNIAIITLGVGLIQWRRDRRAAALERARRPLLCTKCGYDRRGLAEGAVCPECGSTPPPQTPLRASASPR